MRKSKVRVSILSFFILLLLPTLVLGFPSNSWKHIKGDHFTVSYNKKTEHLAEPALQIAEEIYDTLGNYFGGEINLPGVAIVLKDHNDDSNGSSSRYIPLVTIECRKTEFLWRGETEWLRNVLSHELSHTYSLRMMQLPLIITGQTSFSSDSEDKQGEASLTYRHNRLPSWLVEGLAQLGSYEFEADFRDPYREMLLRDAFLNNRMLSLDAMSRFEGTSREYELIYNQGFDFVLFLKNAYPEKSIHDLCKTIMRKGFKKGIQAHYGMSIEALHQAWLNSLEKKYRKQNARPIPGARLYAQKEKPLKIEARSAVNSRYVITNWRHDYSRFDLMLMSEDGRKTKKIAADVGMMLKEDNGSIWFNKEVYSYQTGVTNYDVYHIDQEGRKSRITKGARCMALDAKDGYLMYAAYENGATHIMLRMPDGSEQLLNTFSYETGIYDISMISPDVALLSMGMGKKTTLGMLKKGRVDILFPEIDADIADAVYAGDNRMVFMSTLDGSPQLYWCDLNTRNKWHKLTESPGGVRLPAVEGEADVTYLSCTVYENGQFIRYRLDNLFSKDRPIDISLSSNIAPESADSSIHRNSGALHKNVFSNIVSYTPYFSFSVSSEDQVPSIAGARAADTNIITPGVVFAIQNAPGNLELGINANLKYPEGYKTTSTIYPTGSVWGEYHLWQFRVLAEVTLDTSLTEFGIDLEDSVGNLVPCDILDKTDTVIINAMVGYQVAKDDAVYVSFANLTADDEVTIEPEDTRYSSTTEDYGTIIEGNIGSLDWVHETTQSRFDPGRLGTPYFMINAGADLLNFTYPGYEAYDSANGSIMRIQTQKRFLLWNSRISLLMNADGFSHDGGWENGDLPPYMYTYIGKERLFSGYRDIAVRQMVRGYSEIRFNPLISPFDKTHWYERMHIGAKIEAGAIDYLSESGIDSDNIGSFETAFRYYTYFWPNQETSMYIKYAVPLNEINDEGDSFRIYFGLAL